ncbi:MAG: hypothetical protein JO233_04995 [Candidatus Eremiobacteraeota bacterium]|nr:hypothetical protein [Candidatus Eremiobacteraeota bacterium]
MSEPTPRQLHVHSVPTRPENWRTIVEIVAIMAAGLWALYTFVYEQRIKPLSEQPSFAVPTDISQGPTIHGVAFLTIHKRLINNGNVPIDIAAESLSVYGETVASSVQGPITEKGPSYHRTLRFDVPRHIAKVLYSVAGLRQGAIGGNPNANFVIPPHSSNYEDYLIAVPVKEFPLIRVRREDYIRKSPVDPKVDVRIVQSSLGGYALSSKDLIGEYDSDTEFPIRQ